MLVKKRNPDWQPAENKEIKVGETIEITDAKNLIINGDVDAIDEKGAVISAFELYGVIIENEKAEFQEYMALKKAEDEKVRLDNEKKKLEEELAESKVEKVAAPAIESIVSIKPVVEPVVETKKDK